MKKVTFIGAGSLVFARSLVRDIMTFPALQDCHIALRDINEERLEAIAHDVDRIIKAGNYPATYSATTDRIEAIKDADIVITTILVGGVEAFRSDLEIPMKYGVNLNSGDTRGPGGIMRALRTMPVLVELCKEMEIYCPNAYLLNYTNPMNILCKILSMQTSIKVVGLCHSVQGALGKISKWTGIPKEELDYVSAGLNHQSWLLKITRNGEDISPLIREAIEDPENYYDDPVVCEMFKYFGYITTEAGGQNCEYNQWFRKRPDLVEKYAVAKSNNPGTWGLEIRVYENADERWREASREWNEKPVDLNRGYEYASSIINSLIGDHTLFTFNGNVINHGYISNLPEGSCVEVPILVSRGGIEPISVGALPPQCVMVNFVNTTCETLAAEGAVEGDPKKIFYAIANDPLTSAVCSLPEIKEMTEELLEQNKAYLPQFKSLKVEL